MSLSKHKYSQSQIIVLHRALVRANEAVPLPNEDFIPWLERSQFVIPAGIHVGRLQAQDVNRFELKDQDFRKYVLGYMIGLDCFTETKADALESLLSLIDEYPNLIIDNRRIRRTLREINWKHRSRVHRVWELVDRAYQRYNDNVGLGRPLHIALDVLFDELKECRVFSGGKRAYEELDETYHKIDDLLSKIRAGKMHPESLIRSSTLKLEQLTTQAFKEVSDYWYSEIMVKQYFRDTLIPLATLNNYIDPNKTSDLLGAVWRFINDLTYDPHLLICIPLLRHQPQAPGTRYATLADYIEEIEFSQVRSFDFPSLRERIEQREAQTESNNIENSVLKLLEHPSIRLSHEEDFLFFLLKKYLPESSPVSENKLKNWLSTSLFSIDPRNGVVAQSLSTALRFTIKMLKEGTKLAELPTNEIQELYNRVIRNKFHNIHISLKYPFSSEYLQETRELDPFELREALVSAILEGVYQPASDWVEERELAQLTSEAIKAIDTAEREATLDRVQDLELFFSKLESKLEELEQRALQITFDLPSLKIWHILTVDLFLSLNQSRRKGIFNLPYQDDLMVAANINSITELITDDIKSGLVNSLLEI